jgi:hypothetical protein
MASEELDDLKIQNKTASRVKKMLDNSLAFDEEEAEKYLKIADNKFGGDELALDRHIENLITARNTDFSKELSKVASSETGNAVEDFKNMILNFGRD